MTRGRKDGRTTDMRARIIATATDLFATKGFAATSLQDLADRLDVTKAALYYHFRRKDDLIAEVLAPMVDDIDAWFDRIETHHPGPRAALESYFDIVHRHGGLLAAISRDPGALEAGDTIAHVAGWRERVQTVLAGPDASFAERVRTTVAIVGLARTASLFPGAQVDELRAIAVAAALRALQSD
ncbi:MAG: helix-turn-helix domain-containing protein [Nitriliruptoraceae bacterium]